MRLGFINPIYLPPLNESFMRNDFNFAKYLGYAYGKTLTHFFNTTCGSIILLLIVLDLFKLTDLSKDKWANTWINFLIPVVFFIFNAIIYFYLSSIER